MTEPELAGRRILVVDDEHIVARSIARLLGVWGAIVVGPAATIERALALLRAGEPIDAAVLDVNLRGSPAYPLADVLLARGVPYLFMTGYETAVVPERYRLIPVLQKPFDPVEIVKALAGRIRSSRT